MTTEDTPKRRTPARRAPKREFVAESAETAKEDPTLIPTEGDISGTLRGKIETVDGPDAMGRADELAFMEEFVTIMVHPSTDPNAVPLPFTSVNGRPQYFQRGQPQRVRRKYVEILARAKKTTYTQTTEHDPRTGNVYQKMNPHTALEYPFSVVEDPNPKGVDWLRHILAEKR